MLDDRRASANKESLLQWRARIPERTIGTATGADSMFVKCFLPLRLTGAVCIQTTLDRALELMRCAGHAEMCVIPFVG